MRKELRPGHEEISCAICERTILKGERTENYLAPGGRRHVVCELCNDRAYHEGWIRESAHDELPAMRPREQRRGLIGRLRRRREPDSLSPLPEEEQEPVPVEAAGNGSEPAVERAPDAVEPPPPPRRHDSRHVR